MLNEAPATKWSTYEWCKVNKTNVKLPLRITRKRVGPEVFCIERILCRYSLHSKIKTTILLIKLELIDYQRGRTFPESENRHTRKLIDNVHIQHPLLTLFLL